jgi:hypothetical protein
MLKYKIPQIVTLTPDLYLEGLQTKKAVFR